MRVALVGLRGRGRDHIKAFHQLAAENVEIALMCDVDQSVLDQRAADYEKLSGKRVKTVPDMRQVLDDKSIHAVSFATPNHWHALGTIWACQAGKDVYVEKPGTHNFHEGPKIIEAAHKYKRIVQHGTQNRTSPNIVEAVRKLKEGVIGRVYMARGITYKYHPAFGRITPDPIPAGLNWDAWLGPAPHVPYSRKVQGSSGAGWHLLWDYGNGDLGNQGVHELDIMRWALDLNTHPTKIASMGGNFVFPGQDQQSPQMHSTMYEYAGRDVLLTFETRSGFTNTEAGMGAEYPFLDHKNVVGVIFIGTDGFMIIPDYSSYRVFLGPNRTPGPSKVGAGDISDVPHFANFVKAVRSGNPADLTAGVEELHRSTALAHFANIAWRTGRMLHFDSKTDQFKGDDEANRLLGREYRAPYMIPRQI